MNERFQTHRNPRHLLLGLVTVMVLGCDQTASESDQFRMFGSGSGGLADGSDSWTTAAAPDLGGGTTGGSTDPSETWTTAAAPDLGGGTTGGTIGGTTGSSDSWTTAADPDLGGGSTSTSSSGDGATTDGGDSAGSSDSGGVCEVTTYEVAALVEDDDMGDGDDDGYPDGYPPGWIDKIPLETGTQCNFQNWKDSDGVDPGTPGCHQAYEDADCGSPTNDSFGEECEDLDTLIETNPGAGVCHSHPIGPNGVGVGHPDRFSCYLYCLQTVGSHFGICTTDYGFCGSGGDSAYCECWPLA